MNTRATPLALTAALLAPCFASHAEPGGNYDLIYDVLTGSLTIDTQGGTIISYFIRFDEASEFAFLEDEAFSSTNHATFLAGTSASTPEVLSESNPFTPRAGVFDLGPVLPAGLFLDDTQLSDLMLSAQYVSEFGEQRRDFELVNFPAAPPTNPRPVGNQRLIYDRADGTLTIDTRGESIKYYNIATEGTPTFLEDDDPSASTHVPFIGAFASSTPQRLVEISFRGPAGVFNLGAVLPAGLSQAEFDALPFSDPPEYITDSPGVEGRYDFELAYVPEPTSLGLLAFGGAVLLRRRRA